MINTAGSTFFLDGQTLTNAAGQTATWSGTTSNVELEGGAVFNNLGAFLAETTGAFEQGSGADSSFNNQGTFTKSTNTGPINSDTGILFNSAGGSVDVQTGTLGLLGGGTDTSTTYTVELGATLDLGGSRTIDSASSISVPAPSTSLAEAAAPSASPRATTSPERRSIIPTAAPPT